MKRAEMRRKLGIPPQSCSQGIYSGGPGQEYRAGGVMPGCVLPMGMMRGGRGQRQWEVQNQRVSVHREQDGDGNADAPPPAYHEAIGASEVPLMRMAPVYTPDSRM
jgi:hypothetical protein